MIAIAPTSYRCAALRNLLVCLLTLSSLSPFVLQASESQLSEALVKRRIQALPSGEESIVAAYQVVLRWLEQAAAHQQQLRDYEEQAAAADERWATIQARIEVLETRVLPEAGSVRSIGLTSLESQLSEIRAMLVEADNARDALDRKIHAREANVSEIHDRLREIGAWLAQFDEGAVTVNPGAAPSMLEATQWNVLAERVALTAERRALNARLSTQPARNSIIQAQRAELALQIEHDEALVALLQSEITRRESAEGPLVAIGLPPEHPAYPVAAELAARSEDIRQQQRELAARGREIGAQSDQVQRLLRDVGQRFASARRVVEYAGDSDVLGHALLRHWYELDSYRIDNPVSDLAKTIGDTVITRIDHEEAVASQASSKAFVDGLLTDSGVDAAQLASAERRQLVVMARSNREQLYTLIGQESNLIGAAAQLKDDYIRLLELGGEYETYLAGLVLWVPSHPPLNRVDFDRARSSMTALLAERPDISVRRISPGVLLLLLSAALLAVRRPKMRLSCASLAERIARPRSDALGHTVSALLLTLLIALPLPLLMGAAAEVFATGSSDLSQAIAAALRQMAEPCYLLVLLRELSREGGLGRLHFGWPVLLCAGLYRESRILLRIGLPLALVTDIVLEMETGDSAAALGRLLYLTMIALLIARLVWLMRRGRVPNREQRPLVARLRLRLLALAACIAAFAAVAQGHVHSVNMLLTCVLETLALVLGLSLLHGLLTRWLQVARRRLRMAGLLAYRSGDVAEFGGEDKADLLELSDASAQLLKAGIFAAGIVLLYYLWSPLLPVLTVLDQVTLWSTTTTIDGEAVTIPITLQTLVLVAFLATATFYAARKLPALIELLLRHYTDISPSARYTTSTLVNYAIVGIGLVLALATLGLKWSQLQWLVAALGVGIGFGLQEIVANFISGLIILFERPIRVGDVITVGGQEGTVSRIRIRATTIRDWDGKELLVPNKDFITSQLLNWTLSDQVTRVVINVSIVYGSDVEHALAVLSELVAQHPDVIDDPPARVLFTELGDNALILVARCFIRSVDDRLRVISELHRLVYKRFNAAGLEFAFPQLDVHLDEGDSVPFRGPA